MVLNICFTFTVTDNLVVALCPTFVSHPLFLLFAMRIGDVRPKHVCNRENGVFLCRITCNCTWVGWFFCFYSSAGVKCVVISVHVVCAMFCLLFSLCSWPPSDCSSSTTSSHFCSQTLRSLWSAARVFSSRHAHQIQFSRSELNAHAQYRKRALKVVLACRSKSRYSLMICLGARSYNYYDDNEMMRWSKQMNVMVMEGYYLSNPVDENVKPVSVWRRKTREMLTVMITIEITIVIMRCMCMWKCKNALYNKKI